jgi:hypothetical protein
MQCAALEVHWSGLYYSPRLVIEEDLHLLQVRTWDEMPQVA